MTAPAAVLICALASLAAHASGAPVASVTLLRSSPNPAAEGVPVTFSAGINIVAAPPTGTITLTDTFAGIGTILGTFTVDPTTGGGSLTVTTLAPGLHNVIAAYSGDSSYLPSTSQALQETILSSLTPTGTSLVSSRNPSAAGQSVTFTASVSPGSASTLRPTGIVTFYSGSTVLGTAAVVNSGGRIATNLAALSTTALPGGSHNIQAVYEGDGVFASSTSPVVVQVVQTATGQTATTLSTSASSTGVGQAIIFTAQVSSGSGIPSGTISFNDGQVLLGQLTLDATGQAILITSALAAGTHTISATYTGNATFSGSASDALAVEVQRSPLQATATTLAASANPAPVTTVLALSATVTAAAEQAPPTGTITFMDGTTKLSTIGLQNGTATLTTAALTAGAHYLLADYSGDSNHAPSSGTLAEVVNPTQGTLTVTNLASSANPSTYGQTLSFKATVGGSSVTPTGMVIITAGSSIASMNLDTTGSATFTTSALQAGTTPVWAAYAGSGALAGSISALVPQDVAPAPLTIMASDDYMTLGGELPTIMPSFSGFVGGDTAASLTRQPDCSTTATRASPIGFYASVCSGAIDPNYSITYIPGVVTISNFIRPPVPEHTSVAPPGTAHSVVRKP